MQGVGVGAVGVLMMLYLRVLWVGGAGLGLLGQRVGGRRFVGEAGGDAALIERPTRTPGFILCRREEKNKEASVE